MSPIEARRAVGQQDIVERLDALNKPALLPSLQRVMADAKTEIERLRTQINRIRCLSAYTDAEWAMQEIRDVLWGYRP